MMNVKMNVCLEINKVLCGFQVLQELFLEFLDGNWQYLQLLRHKLAHEGFRWII